jgi:hypothetical protein
MAQDGEYNPDEGCDPLTCPVCDREECICPPESMEQNHIPASFSEWLDQNGYSIELPTPEVDRFWEESVRDYPK